jgi:hypothetical protein
MLANRRVEPRLLNESDRAKINAASNQRFVLNIGEVPDGGSTVSLLGCALLGLAALRRKLSC